MLYVGTTTIDFAIGAAGSVQFFLLSTAFPAVQTVYNERSFNTKVLSAVHKHTALLQSVRSCRPRRSLEFKVHASRCMHTLLPTYLVGTYIPTYLAYQGPFCLSCCLSHPARMHATRAMGGDTSPPTCLSRHKESLLPTYDGYMEFPS